jgi:perosamine synthetase
MVLVTPFLKKNSENCAWVGSGTQAITLLLQEMGICGKWIAVPVAVCPSVVQAVLYSGNQPYYVDIDEDDLGISPEVLEYSIETVSAVIAVHSYGTLCSIKEIAEICHKHHKFLIEDCAQALGAHINGQAVGTFGDAAIFSFGAGKIIDLGYGGAALSDDKSLVRRVESCNSRMPEWTRESEETISGISALHTSLYNRYYPDKVSRHAGIFSDAVLKGKSAYMFRSPGDLPDRVRASLESLDRNLVSRREKAMRFKDIFGRAGLRFHWPTDGGVFWRFNLFMEGGRNGLLRVLLAEGFKVSSWYPRIDIFLDTEAPADKFPVAERIGAEILNLWVNTEIDGLYVEHISNRIIEHRKSGV